MAVLPPSSDFTSSTTTEAAAKTFISGMRDFLSGLLGTDGTAATARTALGAVGPTSGAFTANVTVTGTGTITLQTSGDLSVYRSGGTSGVIFLNSGSTRYLHFDGSNYLMPGAQLYVNGSLVYHAGNLDLSSRVAVDAGAQGVGLTMVMFNLSGASVASGAGVAGSSLRAATWTGGSFAYSASAASGAWRNVGSVAVAHGEAGQFQRYS